MKRLLILCFLVFVGIGTKSATAPDRAVFCSVLAIDDVQLYSSVYIAGDPYVVVGEPAQFWVENLSSVYYVSWSISSSDFIINSAAPDAVIVEATKAGESAVLTARIKSVIDGSLVDVKQIVIFS